MTFKIHYTIKDFDDCFVVKANTLEEIQKEVKREIDDRRLDIGLNNLWSEEIK